MLTDNDFLLELQRRGVKRLRRVSFRTNRSTVWSLTQDGTVLNVHVAYRAAPAPLLDAFATVVREGGIGSARSRRAAEAITEWPQLAAAIDELSEADWRRRREDPELRATHCCATSEQRAYLRALYRYFNHTRFDCDLPDEIPVRLSNRMRTALGQMLPGESARARWVVDIALNVDLMLPGNGPERVDTLLHEMAHVADYLDTGERGHGASWRAWAKRIGCRPEPLYERPVVYRRRRRDRVTRVPPLPETIRDFALRRPAPTTSTMVVVEAAIADFATVSPSFG